ncbi:zinc-binding protein A33-like [Protopterus annectens]|uniref:zinc-binding protein A33-like n=1 Tax=Protopterus annectens TaxID=7888 RepID=UPI001CFBC229|nr:zinc-binding protein A33-like [Protopterus annectens]
MASRGNSVDDLICPVCLEFFNNAVTLECGHNFCKSCIDSYWDSQEALCPTCREKCSAKKYITNRTLTNIAEKAEMWNLDQGRKDLYTAKENDTLTDWPYTGSNLQCREHGERLRFFCEKDKTPVCDSCLETPKHRGHSFTTLQNVVGIYKSKLKDVSLSLESKMNALFDLQKEQEQKINEIRESRVSLEQHITSEFAALHQFLHEKEQRILHQLHEEEEGILRKMEKNMEEIRTWNSEIQVQISEKELWLNSQDPLFLETEWKKLSAKLSDIWFKELELEKKVITGEINHWVYGGPLQYMAWKEMKSVVNPGLSPVTLDINTAQPCLIISEDLTSVRDSNEIQRFTNNPGMFTQIVSVLGSEGFIAGRHYWEVEVGAKTDWNVGVTRESASRSGSVIRNPEQGYWILRLENGDEYKALEFEPQDLSLPVKPWKIGVYLNYEKGQVSFYNADNMTHIYTFTDTFTEKMYPFFNPGLERNGVNAQPLKICH